MSDGLFVDRDTLVAAITTFLANQDHLDEIRASGRFRHTRELLVHGWWESDAERIVGFAESIGGSRELFTEQAPEVGDGFERLRETASRVLGARTWPVLLCYRIRVGIK